MGRGECPPNACFFFSPGITNHDNQINALDALITAYNALSVLRQQPMPGDIIQGHITSGGSAPNIIHAYAAGIFIVRATTQARLSVLYKKVQACFSAAATVLVPLPVATAQSSLYRPPPSLSVPPHMLHFACLRSFVHVH